MTRLKQALYVTQELSNCLEEEKQQVFDHIYYHAMYYMHSKYDPHIPCRAFPQSPSKDDLAFSQRLAEIDIAQLKITPEYMNPILWKHAIQRNALLDSGRYP